MIIYSGQKIVAHSHEGASDYLLVTFSQMYSEGDATGSYFLKPQVEQANISCIGVMTTERGFFLSREMDEVARLVQIARRGRKVVVLGQSMGGYAALKHSAALQADYVIALSPYYSMDPDELDLKSERERRILLHQMASHGVAQRPEFKGMGIRKADVSGRLVVVFDPAQRVDVHDAELIARRLPQVELVRAWHAGHVIYDAAWEAGMTIGLIEAVQSRDPAAFANTLIRARRTHPTFMLRTLGKAVERKPNLAARAFRSQQFMNSPGARRLALHPTHLRLIYILATRGYRLEAQRQFAFYLSELRGPAYEPVPETSDEAPGFLLLSIHGSFLGFDRLKRQIRFEPDIVQNDNLWPVIARTVDGRTVLSALSRGDEIVIPADAWKVDLDVVMFPPTVVAHGAYRVCLKTGDAYFGAGIMGDLHTHAATGNQESFAAIAMRSDAEALDEAALNWLQPTPSQDLQALQGTPALAAMEELRTQVDTQSDLLQSIAERVDQSTASNTNMANMVSQFLKLLMESGAIPSSQVPEGRHLLRMLDEVGGMPQDDLEVRAPRFGMTG